MAEATDGVVAAPDAPAGVLNEEQAFRLIAYLTSAAEISLHEPTYYGSLRLIDAASRLIGFMLENDPPTAAPFLRELKTELDTKKVWCMWDREAFYDFVREVPAGVAAEMVRREGEAQS
ncbi:MAG: hypothetical protein KC442_07570 [Thermomicrobiales bacterium]|nr:hypothetical protein [Thermomicrobiales bacterium]